MLPALFFVLLVLWLLGFFAFHVAGGLIHLLIIVRSDCAHCAPVHRTPGRLTTLRD